MISLSMYLLLIISCLVGVGVAEFTKILLPSGHGYCLDGSPAGFYYAPPISQDSSLWVFYMRGGGNCASEQRCKQRSKTDKGSSVNWKATEKYDHGIQSSNPDINPDFYDSHKVHIPYCTGDGHTGQRITATKETWGFYFSGHENFIQILKFLLSSQTIGPQLKKATHVMLSGISAGGIGAFANIDYLAQTLPWATVKGAPISGWFSSGYTDDQPEHPELPPSDWAHWSQGQTGRNQSISRVQLWNMTLNADCVKSFPTNQSDVCASVNNLYPFIKTPLFVLENQYDTEQIFSDCGLPKVEVNIPKGREFIAYFGRSMRNSTERTLSLKPTDGLFLPSCFDHGAGLQIGEKTIIRGINTTSILGDWYFQRGKFSSYQIIDDCSMKDPGLPCNPTCDNVP